jgi:phosphatidylinositol alpha-mannosyltransferase
MKIGLVSPYDYSYPGGVTAHINSLTAELTKLGHAVKIIAPCSDNTLDALPDWLIPIGKPFPIPTGGSIARISISFWLFKKVQTVLQKEAFDILHIHEPLVPFLPLLCLHLASCPIVGTFHAYENSTQKYFALSGILHRSFNKLDRRLTVSPPARAHINKNFPSEYEIVPNGIDCSRFLLPKNKPEVFKNDKTNILFVGRLEKRKGLSYLLSAFSRLKWQQPNVRLIVVGPGTLDKASYHLIAEKNLQDIELIGEVSHSELPDYYHAADIFCSPATGHESFGIVLLEAMASGKPIVASNIPGYASVMTNDQEGFLVKPKDAEGLAAALQALIEDPQLRSTMGIRGQITAQSYDWKPIAAKINKIYYETISTHRGVPSTTGTNNNIATLI